MGSYLASCFREQTQKMKDSRMFTEHVFDTSYPTGFLSFDFLNGNMVQIQHDKNTVSYFSVGVVDGSINTLIGRSGCGKTTFAIQAASNIIRPFKDAVMYVDSIEGGLTIPRLSTLTGWSGTELRDRVIERNSGITAENFYQRIKLIHDIKLQNRETMSYDTGTLDDLGRPVTKFIPTPYILDSLAMLMPETYTDENELAGQMAATAAAKTNTRIMKTIVPMLKAANIILFLINHINQKVEINAFTHTKAQVSYLKQDETLPGGVASIYLANNIIRFDDTKLKKDEGFGIEGSQVTLSLVKSRTNKAGRSVNLIFNQDTGFDATLSLFTMLKTAGLIVGTGAFFHLDGSDIKFTQKTFKEKLKENPELRKAFMDVSLNYLKGTLSEQYEAQNNNDSYDVTNDILNKLNS